MYKKIIIFLVMLSMVNIVNAETGTIDIIYANDINFTSSPAAGIGVPLYDRLLFDTANYNSIDYLDVVSDSNTSFLLQSNFTFFTCNAPNSCSGAVSYSKTGNIIEWAFNTGAVITSSPIIMTYETNIFDGNNINPANGNAAYFGVNSSIPVCLAFPGSLCTGRLKNSAPASTVSYYRAVVMLETSIDYNITYPISGKYSGSITKSGVPVTKIKLEEYGDVIDYSETTFNNVSFNLPLIEQGNGIYINATMQNSFEKVLINGSNIVVDNSVSGTIETDNASYNLTETVNMTWSYTNADSLSKRIQIIGFTEGNIIYSETLNGTSGNTLFYIPANTQLQEYSASLQYYNTTYSSWHTLSLSNFFILSQNNQSSVQFLNNFYNLGELIEISAYSNETGYILLNDSNGNNILNSSINANDFTNYHYFLTQTDNTGTWTVNLYNSNGDLYATDTTVINFDIVITNATPVPTYSSNGGLIDVGDAFAQVVFGKIDKDNSGEYSDAEVTSVGNKMFSTLLLIAFLLLLAGCYYAISNKKRR